MDNMREHMKKAFMIRSLSSITCKARWRKTRVMVEMGGLMNTPILATMYGNSGPLISLHLNNTTLMSKLARYYFKDNYQTKYVERSHYPSI